ncbi:hypothetical protein BGW38_006233, partial [Lunasporangiospora selenospora]
MSPSPETSTSDEVITSSNDHDNSTEVLQQSPLSEKPCYDHQEDQTPGNCSEPDARVASQDEAGVQGPLPMRSSESCVPTHLTLRIEDHYTMDVGDGEQ